MYKINIIGTGNVAWHLSKAFIGKADASMVDPHTFDGFTQDADFNLISVSDNAIAKVAAAMPPTGGIIAHTSGTTPADILSFKNGRTGVFYPLQTFTKGRGLDYQEIPFFIEGSDPETETMLSDLASLISPHVSQTDSDKRKALHVASVFACNFANHMWAIADMILRQNDLSFDMIRPLLTETLHKTQSMSPFDSQTGPAVRQDSVTVDSHIEFLENNPGIDKDLDLSRIYSLISSSIISTHKNDNV